jgi:O-acetyl-ADP-ribose deacetylase (regulator of RNase III)
LARAVTGALDLADSHHLATLALPAVSTGIFGFPKNRAADVILGALSAYFDRHPEPSLRRVDVTLYDGPTVQAFTRAFHQIWPG